VSRSTLDAAVGWLELGEPEEAARELDRLPPEEQSRPEVLKLRCRIYELGEDWESLLSCAEEGLECCPDDEDFIAAWSWAELNDGRAETAVMKLEKHLDRSPTSERFAYVMTCALRVLNRNEEAGEWMETTVGRAKDLRALAAHVARDSSRMTKLWRERWAR